VIVQIYGLTQSADVKQLTNMGVDHFGFAVDTPPAGISAQRASELMDHLRDGQKATVLTIDTDVGDILATVRATTPDILHICSETHAVSREDIQEIRDTLEFDVEIEKSIEVDVDNPVSAAREYEDVSDFLLLDSSGGDDEIPGVGVTGETHDWAISRRVVDAVEVPLILAGGLSPENVREAIRTVEPDGVDSFTQTSKTMRKKDLSRVKEFTERAKDAAKTS
jgi:phosphoribosylanthranilate isomerase